METVIFDPDKAKPMSEDEIEELRQLCSRPIDFSDILETTEADWSSARRGVFYRPVKQSHHAQPIPGRYRTGRTAA